MIAPICEKVGLGSPPQEYHDNCLECINNVIKWKLRERGVSLMNFA